MKTIGITGGIGSGKSMVLNMISDNYNVDIVEADKIGHLVMEKEMEAYNNIVKYFGKDILDVNGSIDRKELGKIVFKDKEKLEKLNSFVHPAVKNEIIRRKQLAKEKNKDFFVIEAALLIEAGYRDICDEFVYIYANEDVRRERLKSSRGLSDEKITEIMSNQLTEQEFRKYCDKIIDNSGTKETTFDEIKKVLVL